MAIKELLHRRLFMGGAALSLLAMAGAATTLATQSTSAQTPPSPTTPATNGAGVKPTSNEDAAHEANETAEQEAAEDNGAAHHGGPGGRGGSHEDAAHEANETPEREAAEDAAKNAAPSTNPAKPSTTNGTGTTPAQ